MIFEIKDAKRCILTLFFNSLIKYLFLPDPPTCTFLLLFSRLKVIYLFGFQIIFFLERVNKYATLRA